MDMTIHMYIRQTAQKADDKTDILAEVQQLLFGAQALIARSAGVNVLRTSKAGTSTAEPVQCKKRGPYMDGPPADNERLSLSFRQNNL